MDFLFIDFLNSAWRDGIREDSLIDRLDKPGWLEAVLASWGIEVENPPNENERDKLKELRSFLLRLTIQVSQGAALTSEQTVKINEILRLAPVIRQFESQPTQLRLVPLEREWKGVMAEIVASFTELLVKHDPSRVRLCKNPNCRWVFYDESRNRTRRWCSHKTCGNRMNVRQFRQKRKEKDPETGKGE